MPKVSVIIPVYNVEKYLRQCLDSVINQTLQDIEIICINDGSTDGSAAILEEYANKDNRIKIITQENQGLSIARNNGMKIATGEYIAFVDSDDYIVIDSIENMYNNAIKTEAHIVVAKSFAFAEDNSEKTKKRTIKKNRYLNKNEFHGIYNVTMDNYSYIISDCPCVAWSKLFSRKFLQDNNLKFIDKNIFHEDNGFWIKVCACFPKIMFITDLAVMYRIRLGAITDKPKKWENERIKHMRTSIKDAIKYINKMGRKKSKALKFRIKNSDRYNKYFYLELWNIIKYKWTNQEKYLYIFNFPIINIVKNTYKN